MRGISSPARTSVAACAVVIALGACAATYHGLSKAEFVKRGNAICRAAQVNLDAAGATGRATSLAGVQKLYRDEYAVIIRAEITQLRALRPPKADRQTISDMLDGFSTGIDQLVASVSAAKSVAELATLSDPPAVAKAAARTARSYGLSSCGNGA
jgi:hypothetical protein